MVSKPVTHPGVQPRDGYVLGRYESIEFIREIPITLARSSSSSNLLDQASSSNTKRTTIGRKRSSTIGFAESRGSDAKGERRDRDTSPNALDPELNPVEWLMITRSDPGGGIPRFMVERGTPSSIAADAAKFLDWACSKEESWFDQQKARDEKSDGNEMVVSGKDDAKETKMDSKVNSDGAVGNSQREEDELVKLPLKAAIIANSSSSVRNISLTAIPRQAIHPASILSHRRVNLATCQPREDTHHPHHPPLLLPFRHKHAQHGKPGEMSKVRIKSRSSNNINKFQRYLYHLHHHLSVRNSHRRTNSTVLLPNLSMTVPPSTPVSTASANVRTHASVRPPTRHRTSASTPAHANVPTKN